MYCHEALQKTFGASYTSLPVRQMHLLQADVQSLYADEMDGEDDTNVVTKEDAAIELRRRIGGIANLTSYANTLQAGDDRRKAIKR